MRLHRKWKDRGLRLVLVSGDFETDREAAVRFLAEQGVDFPSFLKEGSDMEFIDGLELPDGVKDELRALSPAAYVGNAAEQARSV